MSNFHPSPLLFLVFSWLLPPPCSYVQHATPKACLSPLQLPRIRQADVGAPWGRPRRWWNSASPAWTRSLCWIQPLGSVYLIFSQLWGVGLATAYKTQSAWPRYSPHPPSFFGNRTVLCTVHTWTRMNTLERILLHHTEQHFGEFICIFSFIQTQTAFIYFSAVWDKVMTCDIFLKVTFYASLNGLFINFFPQNHSQIMRF